MNAFVRVVSLYAMTCAFTGLGVEEVLAQGVGSIQGSVSDPSGAALAGAKVTIRSRSSAKVDETRTTNAGSYQFQNLSPGLYAVEAEAVGFQSASEQVEIQAGTSSTSDFHLAIAAFEQQIQVNAAARYARSLADLPVSTTVIPREELLNSPGRSIEESLRYVAGVNLQRDNSDVIFPLVPSISMRGIGVGDTATRTLVLLDEIPLNGAFFGTVFWNRVPKYSVEQVEVVRAASSSLFGSYGEGGVVNVVSYVPDRRRFTADATYGQNDRFQGNAQYGDVLMDDALAFSLNANYYQTNGFYQVAEDEIRPIDERIGADMTSLRGRVDMKFSDTAAGFLRAGYDDQNRSGGTRLEKTNVDVPDVAGGVAFSLGDHGTLDARGFYAHEDFRVDNVNVIDQNSTFVSNRHHTNSNDAGFSTQWSKGWKGWFSHASAGVDFRQVDGQDDQDIFNTPNILDSIVVGGGTQASVGFFGEVSLRPVERLELLTSVRYDHFSNTAGRIITDGVAQVFPDSSFDEVNPRVALRYQVSKPLALRAAYYQGFRAPTLAELYRSFETPTFRGLSNPELKEEHLQGGEFGVDITAGRFYGQISGFYNRLENFVGSVEVGDVGNKFTVINANVGAVRSLGTEFTGTVRLTNRVTLLADYTYTDAQVVEGPLTGNAVEGAPRHVAGLTFNYLGPRGMTLDLRGRWVSKAFQDITNEGLMGAHFVMDLFASYPLQKKYLDLIFVGENLLNRQYVADGFSQALAAPRQVSGGIRVHF